MWRAYLADALLLNFCRWAAEAKTKTNSRLNVCRVFDGESPVDTGTATCDGYLVCACRHLIDSAHEDSQPPLAG